MLPLTSKDGLEILKWLKFRFGKFEFVQLLADATLLDPRFKKNLFNNTLVLSAQRRIDAELKKYTVDLQKTA